MLAGPIFIVRMSSDARSGLSYARLHGPGYVEGRERRHTPSNGSGAAPENFVRSGKESNEP